MWSVANALGNYFKFIESWYYKMISKFHIFAAYKHCLIYLIPCCHDICSHRETLQGGGWILEAPWIQGLHLE